MAVEFSCIPPPPCSRGGAPCRVSAYGASGRASPAAATTSCSDDLPTCRADGHASLDGSLASSHPIWQTTATGAVSLASRLTQGDLTRPASPGPGHLHAISCQPTRQRAVTHTTLAVADSNPNLNERRKNLMPFWASPSE